MYLCRLNPSCSHSLAAGAAIAVRCWRRQLFTTASMGSVKKPAVLYHYPCPDGAFAALAAHLYFSAVSTPSLFFPNTVYDPIRCDSLPLDEISEAYLLDFAGPPGFVNELSSKIDRVTILDHHKTALEALSDDAATGKNVTKIIDMNRSGATIAFDFFRDKLSSAATSDIKLVPDSKLDKVERLFKFIEDGDLWRWKLLHSKAFSSGLKDLNFEFNVNFNPLLFNQLLDLDPDRVISLGQDSLAHKQKLIDECLDKSYEISLGSGQFGHCLAVEADSISNLRSELGNQLAEKSRNLNLRGIGAVVYKVPELKNNEILKISLRSLDSEDTTPISQEYGGGGHRNASSFMLTVSDFEKWKVISSS
ncbi:hypothetical protein LUZ61_010560 [Rhynchospora tenuis]|uniref:DHHA1 domain-containing protein n=1 Tax=Rhynchospora tenuis TaxID=198213 RepID=A0AAD6EZL9_9POAL|nr:hypothetical protein LUZ61_010560 [Rhynchospora tenuis]